MNDAVDGNQDEDCTDGSVPEPSALASGSKCESQDTTAGDRPGAAGTDGGVTISTPPSAFQLHLGGEGLEAFASTSQPAPLPATPSTRQLRSAVLKKPWEATAPQTNSADDAATMKISKLPAARGYQLGGRDEQEALRHVSLQSSSNRLGGGNLYAFRDSVGSKRARDDEDQDQAEVSFAKAKRLRALKTTTALKNKLADLENAGSNLGRSTLEMLLLFREESERKSEARRIEEEARRRDEAAAKEACLEAEKVEVEVAERRRQEKVEAEERARRGKDDARARMQDMLVLISAIFKKE
ncbi:unnamed protein product [Phytophthora fragariaefolia]|uniref:Unnamed protein product n=1 Tax=Phytophthora fragariaefolia TaxID=1490495 RepID=A0A9W6X9Z2_9STRA|nr:unnamed protein product [Phytophthora fragariaefolia]